MELREIPDEAGLVRDREGEVVLVCNLLDQSFRPDMCSTRWQETKKFKFVRDLTVYDGVSIFVDGHALHPEECDSPVKIAWIHEPPCLGQMHTVYSGILDVAQHYQKILTYHPDLLALGHPYAPLIYGGSWIPESEWGMRPKRHLCSMLIGDKMATQGHRLRHEIAELVKGRGVQFYGTKGIAVGYERDTKLRVNGDYMFTIVTETCRMDNEFTEWLLDPLSVGTVPIFAGCPNIGNYFDTRGILQFETAEECLDIVRLLTPALYESMLPYVRVNRELMREYAYPDDSQLYDKYLKEYDN